MRTYNAKAHEVKRNWFIIDANGKILGRLAAQVASILRGKHKPEFTPHVDTGDYIIIVNSDEVQFTGNKLTKKQYHSHTGYPGGIKSISLEKKMAKDSRKVIEEAVRGMLPKNSLGREVFRKLKVYKGSEHPHTAQQPEELTNLG